MVAHPGINEALSFLSDSIREVEVTATFKDILKQKQLEDVNCAAINLSAAVTEYLTMTIESLSNEIQGKCYIKLYVFSYD